MPRFCSKSSQQAISKTCCLLLTALLCLSVSTLPVVASQDDPDRTRAFQLYQEGKYTDALPLFEKLEKTYPNDLQVLETYALILYGQNAVLKDAAARKEARKHAREIFVRAIKVGSNSALTKSMIETIPVDGGADIEFSPKREVDEAMREGEEAFVKGDYPKAIDMYQRALVLDPNLYEAALFTGDVYYKSAEQKKAGDWFARAIAINPDRETAYRYWGDSLMKQGRVTEAGDKFVEAFIAEPYNRLARVGLVGWAQKVNLELAHPKIEIPTNVSAQQSGSSTISLDPSMLKKDDKSGAAWMTYSIVRASWIQGEFAKQYPNEKTYRHSLKEEVTALRAALKVLDLDKHPDMNSISPSLQAVAKLDKDGLLESYILLAIPDEGISKDFGSYRKSNVDKLRKYVVDYVMTGGGGKN